MSGSVASAQIQPAFLEGWTGSRSGSGSVEEGTQKTDYQTAWIPIPWTQNFFFCLLPLSFSISHSTVMCTDCIVYLDGNLDIWTHGLQKLIDA